MPKRIFFLNHTHSEEPISELKSHKNHFESEFVVRLVQYFLHQEYEPNQVRLLYYHVVAGPARRHALVQLESCS